MSSHARQRRSHKPRMPETDSENEGGVNLTPPGHPKSLSSKTHTALARQSRGSPPSSDRDELQEASTKRPLKSISVLPERAQDDEHENESDDVSRLLPQ